MDNGIYDSQYISIVDHIDNGIVLLDPLNCITIWNRFMEKHSGIKSQDLIGKNIFDVFPYLPRVWLELKLKSVKLLKSYSFISWNQRPYLFKFDPKKQIIGGNLEYMYQDSTFLPITDQENGNTSVCIIIKDVTDIVNCNRQIEEMKDMTQTLVEIANYDTLTEIFNRGYIEKQLQLEFNRAKRYQYDFSVILLDIDNFKQVNDKYGHLAGDEVLRQLSLTISAQLRDSDVFGRFGGEEFIIILPNVKENESKIVTEKLRQAIEQLTVSFKTFTMNVTISQGFVQYTPDMKDYLQMLHEADLAMYHSKKNGRNQTSQFSNNESVTISGQNF